MNGIEGYRTIIVALVGGPLTAWLSKHGLDMTPEVQAWFVGAVMSVLMVIMRLVTKSPVGVGSGGTNPPPVNKQGGYVRPVMLALLLAISVTGMIALPACSTLQQVQQLPFDRQLELAYQTHTEVTQQVAKALDAKTISVGTAKAYLDLAEGSRKALDEARALGSIDISTAEARLQLAKDILTRAQAELIKRGAK